MSEMFFGIPEGIAAQLRAQHDHRMMHRTEETHRVRDFLNGLDKEQLEVLEIMLQACNQKRNISHFIGRITVIQEYKFNECPCGEDHSKLPEDMGEHAEQIPEMRDPEEEAEERHYAGEEEAGAGDADDFMETLVRVVGVGNEVGEAATEADIMAKYGIEEDPRYPAKNWGVEDGPAPQPFRCINCGQGYASIADRCLRPPKLDGCSGCQLKSAHG